MGIKQGYMKAGKYSGKIGTIKRFKDNSVNLYQIKYEDGVKIAASENDIIWLYRRRHFFQRWKWVIAIFLALIAFILGVIGFTIAFKENRVQHSSFSNIYMAFQLFTLQMGYLPPQINWQLEVARFLAPIVFFYTIWQAVASVLKYQFQMVKLRFIHDHVIICGLGQKGMLLVKSFCQRGVKVVVIDADQNNANIKECRELGAIVIFGNASDCEMLRKARVDSARYLISVCNNDGINSQIAVNTHNLCAYRKGYPLTCYVHISDPELCDLLKEQEIVFGKVDMFRHEYFNIYRQAAKSLLLTYPLPTDDKIPHIMIVGLGKLGESLILQAAQNEYLRNKKHNCNLQITVFDSQATNKVETLKIQYPWLEKISHIITKDIDASSVQFRKFDWLKTGESGHLVTNIYVAMENDQRSVSVALSMAQRARSGLIPVVVCMKDEGGLGMLLSSVEDKGNILERICPFGVFNRVCKADVILQGTHEFLAQAIHEEYVSEEKRKGYSVVENPVLVEWCQLSEGMKESNRRQADFIGTKLHTINCSIRSVTTFDFDPFSFSDQEIETLAVMEHTRWMKEKKDAGWVYAPSPKNEDMKTNPCLVPWQELPEEERNKDRDTARNIPNLMAKIGFEVYRINN